MNLETFVNEMEIKVENMIYKIAFDQNIDLVKFMENVKSSRVEYNPKSFSGVIYRVDDPRVSLLIFDSGKVMCAGAKCRDDVDRALCKLLEKFNAGKIEIKSYPTIEVQNIVAAGNLGFKVNLDVLAMECENMEYEPEQFPAVILRLDDPEVSVSIFSTGKINITGAKSEESVKREAGITENLIKEYGAVIPEHV